MDMYRRDLMKGALMGSTLLALGIPPMTMAASSPVKPGRLRLLLGSGGTDAGFAAGARTAFAAEARRAPTGSDAGIASDARSTQSGLEVIKLKGGLLNEYEKVIRLLETFRDTRWVAVMDDGSAAVFTELVRNAGGSLVLLGSHVSSAEPSVRGSAARISGLRHVWAGASSSHAAGGILATRLREGQRSFSIVENFFSAPEAENGSVAQEFPPGFLAWRLDGPGSEPDPAYLYCAGVSQPDACELLGWHASSRWTPIDREAGLETAVSGKGKRRDVPGNGKPHAGGWVEAVGYAVAAAALSAQAGHAPCSQRAYVYQPDEAGRGMPGEAVWFSSFVVDI
jgi:hypothetical protein